MGSSSIELPLQHGVPTWGTPSIVAALGATEVHLTTVARVIVTESRRNWLCFARYQFRKNWSSRRLLFCLFACVVYFWVRS